MLEKKLKSAQENESNDLSETQLIKQNSKGISKCLLRFIYEIEHWQKYVHENEKKMAEPCYMILITFNSSGNIFITQKMKL